MGIRNELGMKQTIKKLIVLLLIILFTSCDIIHTPDLQYNTDSRFKNKYKYHTKPLHYDN